MSPIRVNLGPGGQGKLRDADRAIASPDGTHFFTFRPDWPGPIPEPFSAAAATVTLLAEQSAPRVLILGFGMGAVAGLMRKLRADVLITGVEPDQKLCDAARSALDHTSVLHRTDAESFLEHDAATYDLVFDDCFVVKRDEFDQDQPYRPAELETLPALAKQRLTDSGLYVRNLLDQEDLPMAEQRRQIKRSFRHQTTRSFDEWDNHLVVASDAALSARAVRNLGRSAK